MQPQDKQSAWTPGPWGLDTGFEVISIDGGAVATTFHDDAIIFRSEGECIANARLIAAAPDLYEALEFWCAEDPDVPRRFRAALAKAKGEHA